MTRIPGPRAMGGALAAASLLSSVTLLTAAPPAVESTLADGRAVRVYLDPATNGRPGRESYAVQRADGTWADERTLDPAVHLRWASFDPLAGGDDGATDGGEAQDGDGAVGTGVPAALASGEGARLHVVQFATQWVEGYRTELEAVGAEVHQHLPATARIVRMDGATAEAVRAMPFVRWVGPYHPAHRVDERLLAAFDGATFRLPRQRYVVRLIDPAADRPAFAAAVLALGGTVDRLDAGSLLSEVSVRGDRLAALLALDEVLFVDPWGPYETDMVIAREIGGAAELETVAGFDGEGVRGEVMDGGFNQGHVDFASRPLIVHGGVGSSSHGAATSGIVFGDGTGDTSARGLLPAGQGIIADYGSVSIDGPSRYTHTGELVSDTYRAVFQSCSFGSPTTTSYTNASAQMDAMIRDFDLSILQSQSNTGSQNSRPQAWAKNVISVGGVQHQGTLTKTDDRWSNASVGPAADGRIKPDLTHFYDDIRTVTCCGSTSYTNSFGGTSGATPIVAGYLGLFYDMWADGIFGNDVVPGDAFTNRSRQSTAKAALINTAVPYDWTVGGPNANLTRTRQGWGMPSAIALHEQRDSILVVDETEIVPNLGAWSSTVTVLPETPSFRVTLTWADPPGTTSSSIHRINDLDLRVTGPNGVVHLGNVGLLDGPWSVPGGVRDDRNTVENVFVAAPAAGTWTIEVRATELNEDGHVETPGLDADFALVASGGLPIPPTLVVQLVEVPAPLVVPGEAVPVRVRLEDGLETLDPATAVLRWRAIDGEPVFDSLPLVPVDGEPGTFSATIPATGCSSVEFFVTATSVEGTTVTQPADAPAVLLGFDVGILGPIVADDFEASGDWTAGEGGASEGQWIRGVPEPGAFPAIDGDGSGSCWTTALPREEDLDGGSTVLLSPVFELADVDVITVSFLRYFFTFGDGPDSLVTEITLDGGATWTEVDAVDTLATPWTEVTFPVEVPNGATGDLQVRFIATDGGPDSSVEAAIDGFRITGATCSFEPADVDGNGTVDFGDLLAVVAAWGPCNADCPADVDGDGDVDFDDVLGVVADWT